MPAILALIEGIIQATPEAMLLWDSVKSILSEGRDPTTAEWAALNAQADAAHAAMQS